jgi:hypothetical protein
VIKPPAAAHRKMTIGREAATLLAEMEYTFEIGVAALLGGVENLFDVGATLIC